MMRQCTQSRCRRRFRVVGGGPVRCPYCGHTYPRLMPDPGSRDEPWGFGLRICPGDRPLGQIRKILAREMSAIARQIVLYAVPQTTFCLAGEFSLQEAEALAHRLCRRGLTSQPIPARVMALGRDPIVRLRR